MHSSDAAIEVQQVRYRIPGSECDLFESLSFSARAGQILILSSLTPGAGSRLIGLLMGSERPISGDVRVSGQSVPALKAQHLARLHGSIGVVADFLPLLEDRDLLSNVILPLEFDSTLDGASRHRIEQLLRELRIFEIRHRLPREVSAVERSKAEMARALAREPRVLLLDEPTLRLNDEHCAEVADLLRMNALKGMTIVIACTDERLKNGLPAASRLEITDRRATESLVAL